MLDDHAFDSIVRSRLRLLDPHVELSSESSLVALGLGSMDSVQLLLDLEEAYGVDLPDSLVTRETFETPASLRRAFDSVART